jgi:site-specific DNA-cytosine methylase
MYIVAVYLLNSTEYFLSQDRKRLWIIGIRRDIATTGEYTPDNVIGVLNHHVGLLQFPGQMLPLKKFILPSTHSAVKKYYADIAKYEMGRPSRGKWATEHMAWCGGLGEWSKRRKIECTEQMCQSFPGARLLTERQVDMLSCFGVSLPSSDMQIIDVSQSIKRAKVRANGTTPTLTPRGQYLLTDEVRIANYKYRMPKCETDIQKQNVPAKHPNSDYKNAGILRKPS